jgi:hypothetical protein
MDEEGLRQLAGTLRTELPEVIDDDEERQAAEEELDAALALPAGEAFDELFATLRRRPETRRWVADRTDAGEAVTRSIPGLPGTTTQPLGVHVVCPNGDFDAYLESPTEALGRCPYDGTKLVRAD